MSDLLMIACMPRPKGMTFEQMVIEVFIARTGHPPSEKEWERLLPSIEALKDFKPKYRPRPVKFRG